MNIDYIYEYESKPYLSIEYEMELYDCTEAEVRILRALKTDYKFNERNFIQALRQMIKEQLNNQ